MNAPTHEHCVCMSGLTEGQVKLLELSGALQVVEWLACEAYSAHAGLAPVGNPDLADYLKKLQLGLCRAQQWCRENGWKRGAP